MRHRPVVLPVLALVLVASALSACSTTSPFGPQPETPPPAQPAVVPTLPPAFPPQDIVGRWGLAAYHKEEDRPRIEAAAAQQCSNPYVISPGPTGGVMMHLADQATPTELRLKGAPGGKTYIGPGEDPPGGMQDREVVSFDGRILILRWVDPEVQGRYGTMVYVRCGPEGTKKARPKAKPRPQAKPKST
jgi:hypothetical protein